MVTRLELDGNADAVDFCPSTELDILAAATYTLVEPDDGQQRRVGDVSLFQVGASALKLLDRVRTSGVFDIRWRPRGPEQRSVLAAALSDGDVRLWSYEEEDEKLQPLEGIKATDSMSLFLEWDPYSSSTDQRIVVSHSDGSASTLGLSNQGLVLVHSWQAHDFEVWTATYDHWTQELVYTGADDSCFCAWDLRSGTHQPVFRDRKTHQMGVCCVQSSPLADNRVATGSYDGILRLWDTRMVNRPLMEHSLDLGGGVWRIKWHPRRRDLIAAACMHNGFAIVQVSEHSISAEVVQEYKEHQSLAYGIDWSKAGAGSFVASCSFYDRALHVWESRLV